MNKTVAHALKQLAVVGGQGSHDHAHDCSCVRLHIWKSSLISFRPDVVPLRSMQGNSLCKKSQTKAETLEGMLKAPELVTRNVKMTALVSGLRNDKQDWMDRNTYFGHLFSALSPPSPL